MRSFKLTVEKNDLDSVVMLMKCTANKVLKVDLKHNQTLHDNMTDDNEVCF